MTNQDTHLENVIADNASSEPVYLDEKKNLKTASRRDYLKYGLATMLGAGAVGTGAGYGTKYAVENGIKAIVEIFDKYQKDIKELQADLRAAYGVIDERLKEKADELREHYTSEKLRIYEELGFGDPAEIKEFEVILDNFQKFEAHYDRRERANILRDRLKRRLLKANYDLSQRIVDSEVDDIDIQAEESKYNPLRGVNDFMRRLAGKRTAKEGEDRTEVRRKATEQALENQRRAVARYDVLCEIYNVNEDNRIAETEIVGNINNYLSRNDLSREERNLYEFLKEEYADSKHDSKNLKDFVLNYDDFKVRNDVLLGLQASLKDAEQIYGKIQENREYVSNLQKLLIEGIEKKKRVRELSDVETEKLKEMETEIDRLRTDFNEIVKDFEDKGYGSIETRQEYIDKGYMPSWMVDFFRKDGARDIANSVGKSVGVITGGATLLGLGWLFNRRHKVRSLKSAHKNAVEVANSNAGVAKRNHDIAVSAEKVASKYQSKATDAEHNAKATIDELRIKDSEVNEAQKQAERYRTERDINNDIINRVDDI